MITIAHLRTLLERALTHAENPAIVRLPESERTWGHVARAYLPHVIYGANPITGARLLFWPSEVMTAAEQRVPLDLTDPGTAHALLVALALALGLDPGVGGLACAWFRRNFGGYILLSDSTNWTFETVKIDAIGALALAALHVLEHP